MKKFIIIIIILILIYVGIKLSIGSPDESIPQATDNSSDTNTAPVNTTGSDIAQEEQISPEDISISFTGYGPGKEEHGTVKAKSSTLSRTGATFKGNVVFDMSTI